MEQVGPRHDLVLRLQGLGARIAKLKQEVSHAEYLARIENIAEVDLLEQRQAALEDRLREMERQSPGFLRNVGAEFKTFVDDLAGAAEDFALRLDSQRADQESAAAGADRA